MADDIKFKVELDVPSLKKSTKAASKIINRFNKTTEKTSKRRVARSRKTESAIRDIRLKNIQRLMALDAKQTKARKREAEQRRKAEIREEKKLATEKARIQKKSAARRRRISRGVGKGAKGAAALFGIAGGATILFKAREILKFDEALARTSVQAGITVEDQLKLRNSINQTSISYGVQRDVILEAVNQIVDKSGDIGLAADNLEVMSMLIRGTGAEAQDIGRLFASIRNAFKGSGNDFSSTEIAEFVEILVSQGDKAQITIANLASEGEKLFGAFKGAGLKSKKDFISFGSLIQASGEGGTASEAATSAVRFLASLTMSAKKIKDFGGKNKGFNIFKPGTKKELKDLDKIIKGVFDITEGDITSLQALFPNKKALDAIRTLAAEYRNTNGEIKSFVRSQELGANAADNIKKKYERVSKTASQGFEKMKAAFTVVLDSALAPILDDIAKAMTDMTNNPEALRTLQDTFKALATVLRLAAKVPGFFAGVGRAFAGGKAGKIRQLGESKSARLRMEVERNRLKFLEQRSPAEKEALETINLQLQNNIVVDERGQILKSEAVLKEQFQAARSGKVVGQKSVLAGF